MIAHRGASGYLPEHTLEAAALAFALGSDYIEQDLVLSKDGVPVVLHDIYLDSTTNVADIYPDRKQPDGRFYVIDFTLSELKSLTVHERKNADGEMVFPGRYQGNGHYTIATFAEQIELINNLNRQFNAQVGFYPEIKAPRWHREQGYDISKIVIELIRQYQLDTDTARLYLQCFDFAEIKRIRSEFAPKFPLVQLIGFRSQTTDYDYLRTRSGVREMSQYVQGVGPAIPHILRPEAKSIQPTDFMVALQKSGLEVHPYTHRSDRLPPGVTSEQLLNGLFSLGATGVFTDFPDHVKAVLIAR